LQAKQIVASPFLRSVGPGGLLFDDRERVLQADRIREPKTAALDRPGNRESRIPVAKVRAFRETALAPDAKRIACCADARSTPAISNITRPGFTTATHFSGGPLPLPILVSAGFLVYGLSGKIRIHNFPPRLMNRVIATREASICRSVIQAGSSAFNPYSPNASAPPRHALPVRRPRCCLRYLTFFGINIMVRPCP